MTVAPRSAQDVDRVEAGEKLERLRSLMGERYDVIVLRSPENVAWLSGGARTYVQVNAAVGVAAVVVTSSDVEVVTTANEAPRLQEEELDRLEASWRVVPWWEDMALELPRGTRVASDVAYLGAVRVDVAPARLPLTPGEIERYRNLGGDAAEALTEAARSLSPDLSENGAAAYVAAQLLARGVDPVVLLVAGASRRLRHRHALPTARRLGELAMVTVCGRRGGLIVNLTRMVAFGRPAPAELQRYRALETVEAAFLGASRPGVTWRRAFLTGCRAYLGAGFDEHEWMQHHQGGPTGYQPREYLATARSTATIVDGQALAWNPTVPGLKLEDTVLVRADGLEVLTVDPAWPTHRCAGLARPQILTLS